MSKISIQMAHIPEGEFLMGQSREETLHLQPILGEGFNNREIPQHSVQISSFSMGVYPVTQDQWRIVAEWPEINIPLNPTPSRFVGEDHPVDSVTWFEAVEFCNRLSLRSERLYRLPSEAEWEYACRAGSTTPFHFGATITSKVANYDVRLTYSDESPASEQELTTRRRGTTSVRKYAYTNAFGLYDMHGNVWEWCLDHWSENYNNALGTNIPWETREENTQRVGRGGCWAGQPWNCRSASRSKLSPTFGDCFFGFRIVSS